MSQQNEVRHQENCPIIVEASVSLPKGRTTGPSPKRKEDSEQTLYLNRI